MPLPTLRLPYIDALNLLVRFWVFCQKLPWIWYSLSIGPLNFCFKCRRSRNKCCRLLVFVEGVFFLQFRDMGMDFFCFFLFSDSELQLVLVITEFLFLWASILKPESLVIANHPYNS